MVQTADILSLVKEAIVLALLLALPLLGAALVSAIFTVILQSMTKVSETAISIVPRIVAVMLTLVIAGPWMSARIAGFAERVWSLIQAVDL